MTKTFTIVEADITSCDEFDDGDPPSAACLNPLGEAAASLALYARNRVGPYRTRSITQGTTYDSYTSLGSTTASTWGTGDVSLGWLSVKDGDIISVQVFLQGKCSAAEQASFRLAYKYAGGSMTGIACTVRVFAGSLGNVVPFSMGCVFEAPSTGAIEFYIQMQVGAGATLEIFGPISPILESKAVVI